MSSRAATSRCSPKADTRVGSSHISALFEECSAATRSQQSVMIDLGAAGKLCRVSQVDASVRALAS